MTEWLGGGLQNLLQRFESARNLNFECNMLGLLDILKIIGSLGFFIFGMKIMSESIQVVAGSGLRKCIRVMTSNRFYGVITGFLITAILQSSSATTVMTVSFVNAGLLSLIESAGIMMGANIGTTITGWLVSIIGFKLKIANFALPIIAIAFPFIFSKNFKRYKLAEFFIGFALLFMGLAALKDNAPQIDGILNYLKGFDNNLLSRFLFVIVGACITIILQSSTAAMALTILFTTQGLPIEIATCMVLGENIGTTITAELAALVGNVHAKRSARIHSLFNIIGVFWMIFMIPYFIDIINTIFDASSKNHSNKFVLAAFHTIFNITNVILCLGFVKQIVWLATKTVKSKGDSDEEYSLKYIDTFVGTPEISIMEANKELKKGFKYIKKSIRYVDEIIDNDKNIAGDKDFRNQIFEKIKRIEAKSDKLEHNIINYFSNLSVLQLSQRANARIRVIQSVAHNIENVCDISKGIAFRNHKVLKDKNQPIDNEALDRCLTMIFRNLKKAYKIANANIFVDNLSLVSIDEAERVNKDINQLCDQAMKANYSHKTKNNIMNVINYKDTITDIERISNHIFKITYAIVDNFSTKGK